MGGGAQRAGWREPPGLGAACAEASGPPGALRALEPVWPEEETAGCKSENQQRVPSYEFDQEVPCFPKCLGNRVKCLNVTHGGGDGRDQRMARKQGGQWGHVRPVVWT